MKRTLTTLFACIAIVITLPSFGGEAGSGAGNGGDQIRARFISRGKEILYFLSANSNGKEIAGAFALSIPVLRETLSIYRIKVVTALEQDNTESQVDEIGQGGELRLLESAWKEILSPVTPLHEQHRRVLHGMLRAAGINDDNYLVSSELDRFNIEARDYLNNGECVESIELEYNPGPVEGRGGGKIGLGITVAGVGRHWLTVVKRNGSFVKIPARFSMFEVGATAALIGGEHYIKLIKIWTSDDPKRCALAKDIFEGFWGTGISASAAVIHGASMEVSYLNNGKGYHLFLGPGFVGTGMGVEASVLPIKSIKVRPLNGFSSLSAKELQFFGIRNWNEQVWGQADALNGMAGSSEKAWRSNR